MSLPLRLGFIALPVVGDVPGVAELAAGSPVVEPRPLGTPLCADSVITILRRVRHQTWEPDLATPTWPASRLQFRLQHHIERRFGSPAEMFEAALCNHVL